MQPILQRLLSGGCGSSWLLVAARPADIDATRAAALYVTRDAALAGDIATGLVDDSGGAVAGAMRP